MALTLSAPAPTGAGLSAFLDAYLKGRGVQREDESDSLRRTLAAMQLLQAGQQYQAGERTAAEQALLPEAIRSALAVPQQTMTLPPTAVPGSETLPPDVSEYYTGRGTPTMLPGGTVPVGRTFADVAGALKGEQLMALLKQAPGVLPAMGLQSQEQIRQRERLEHGQQKRRALQVEIENLAKAGRVVEATDKEIELTGVVADMMDTPEKMANLQIQRQNLLALRQTQEEKEEEKRLGPGEATRLYETQQRAVRAKRDGTPQEQADAMGDWFRAISSVTTVTGRRYAAEHLQRINQTLSDQLVEDPTERNFWKAVSTEMQAGLARNESWSRALLVKSARTVLATPAYGAMLFKKAMEKTLPDWLEEAWFGSDSAWAKVKALGGKDAAIGAGVIVEGVKAGTENRAPDPLKALAEAQAWAQGKRSTDPIQMALLRQSAQTLLDNAQQRLREAERRLTELQTGGPLLRNLLPAAVAEVQTAKDAVDTRAREVEAIAQMALVNLPPALREVYEKGKVPPPKPPPPAPREPLSRKDPRYQGARKPQPKGLGLTDAEIEQRYGVQLVD